jgi:hypothetical protein
MILYTRTPSSSRSSRIGALRRPALLLALFLSWNIFAFSGTPVARGPARLTPPMALSQVIDTMIARNAQRARNLRSYQGRRVYNLVYQGFPGDLHASLVVNMDYQAPDTKQFNVVSQSGPKFLVDQVLKRLVKTEIEAQRGKTRRAVNLDRQNYDFSDLEYVPAADGCSYVVSVEPKHRSKYLYRGKIWINDRDFAVCHIQAQPAENPSFWIRSTEIAETYEEIGKFWLPEKNRSVSQIRFGGRATLTIQYQDYKLLGRPAHATSVSSAAAVK